MRIAAIYPQADYQLAIIAEDGREAYFDVSPFLHLEAFAALKNTDEFKKISNGSYFIEWECGADLSADTIESRWQPCRSG